MRLPVVQSSRSWFFFLYGDDVSNDEPLRRSVRFDPFGWAERFLPARALHRLVQGVMALVCLGFGVAFQTQDASIQTPQLLK